MTKNRCASRSQKLSLKLKLKFRFSYQYLKFDSISLRLEKEIVSDETDLTCALLKII